MGIISGRIAVASVYLDGGKLNNKIKPNQKFTLKEGSKIVIRPPVKKRDDNGMHDVEFRVIEVIEVKLEDEEVEKEDEGNTKVQKLTQFDATRLLLSMLVGSWSLVIHFLLPLPIDWQYDHRPFK